MGDDAVSLYLELLKRCVCNLIYQDPAVPYLGEESDDPLFAEFSLERRLSGHDWPRQAHTMIGAQRLDNVRTLIEDVLRTGVAGDLIETGVWRGGSTIFMRGVLKAHNVTDRAVWVADSFQAAYPAVTEHGVTEKSYTSPGVEILAGGPSSLPPEVQDKFGAASGHVLRGGPRDLRALWAARRPGEVPPGVVQRDPAQCPDRQVGAAAAGRRLLRRDASGPPSLYPKLSIGGWVIVDDYGSFAECAQAVHDYLDEKGIHPEIVHLDDEAVYWRKAD